MSAWASYAREGPLPAGERVEDEVVSHDFGPKYAAVVRLVRLAPSNRIVVERALAYNCQGPAGEMDKRTVYANMFRLFTAPEQRWCWEPACMVIGESQVDGLYALHRDTAGGGDANNKRKPAINEQMECFIMAMVMARSEAPRLLPAETRAHLDAELPDWFASGAAAVEPLGWTPRSGKMKSALASTLHDAARKRETLDAGPRVMREEEGTGAAVARWVESLGRPKPREDVCDAYLQGHRYLHDRYEAMAKQERKLLRAQAAQSKRDEKERRRIAREARQHAKKRPRPLIDLVAADDDDEATIDMPSTKKARTE